MLFFWNNVSWYIFRSKWYRNTFKKEIGNSIKSDIDLAIYCDNSIVDFIEDIEMNTSTLLEFDFSDMKDIKDGLFIEHIKKHM